MEDFLDYEVAYEVAYEGPHWRRFRVTTRGNRARLLGNIYQSKDGGGLAYDQQTSSFVGPRRNWIASYRVLPFRFFESKNEAVSYLINEANKHHEPET